MSRIRAPIATVADLLAATDEAEFPVLTRRVLKANTRTAGFTAAAAKAREGGRSINAIRDDALLATVPAEPAWLNKYLFAYPAALCGTSEKCLQTSVVGLRRSMRYFNLIDPPTNSKALPAASKWRRLLDRLEADYAQTALATFGVWCHAAGVDPQDVTQHHLKAFERWLWTRTLHSEIPRLVRNVCKAWRRAASLLRWASGDPLTPPPRRETYVPPLSAYAEILQAEVGAFSQWYSGSGRKGPFRGKGPRRIPRPNTVKAREYSLLQALAALIRTGRKTPETVRLADLTEAESFEAILQFHWDRAVARRTADRQTADRAAPVTHDDPSLGVTAQTGAIAATLMILARHYFKLDAKALEPLRAMAQDLTPKPQTQLSRKNLDRLRQFDDPVTRAKLLHLPRRIKTLIEGGSYRPMEAARMARVAGAIEFLLHVPLRNGNLCMLRLGVHLRYDGSRLGYIRRLVVQKHETKNSYEGEWPIGDELGSVLDWYIKTYRPLLAPPGNDCLFPAGFGQPGPLSNAAMYNSIVNTVADFVGAALNPHLFRCICACLILEHSPEALEDVRLMIGDKSLEMVLAHYVASQPRHAAKRTDELLRRLRRDSVHLIGDLANPRGRMPR
jgi:hypothetical protein